MQDLLGRLITNGITEFGRMANELGYGLPYAEGGQVYTASAAAPVPMPAVWVSAGKAPFVP